MFHYFCYSSLSSPYNGGRYSGITVDFRKADMRNVENMNQTFSYAFAYDKSVDSVTIDFSEAIMGSVTNMNQMFYYFGYGNSY
jgi:hypothetical protein